jgi:hypothetical protein
MHRSLPKVTVFRCASSVNRGVPATSSPIPLRHSAGGPSARSQVLDCLRFLVDHDFRHVHFSFGAGRGRFVSEDMGTVNLVPSFASDRWIGHFAANWLASNASGSSRTEPAPEVLEAIPF